MLKIFNLLELYKRTGSALSRNSGNHFSNLDVISSKAKIYSNLNTCSNNIFAQITPSSASLYSIPSFMHYENTLFPIIIVTPLHNRKLKTKYYFSPWNCSCIVFMMIKTRAIIANFLHKNMSWKTMQTSANTHTRKCVINSILP